MATDDTESWSQKPRNTEAAAGETEGDEWPLRRQFIVRVSVLAFGPLLNDGIAPAFSFFGTNNRLKGTWGRF